MPGTRPYHSGPRLVATSVWSKLIFHLSLFCSFSGGSLTPTAQADKCSVIIIDVVASAFMYKN